METSTLNELNKRLESIESAVLQLLQNSQKAVLSADEAAEYLGIASCTLYKLMDTDPTFPEFRPVGVKRRIIPRKALDKWLAQHAVERNRPA